MHHGPVGPINTDKIQMAHINNDSVAAGLFSHVLRFILVLLLRVSFHDRSSTTIKGLLAFSWTGHPWPAWITPNLFGLTPTGYLPAGRLSADEHSGVTNPHQTECRGAESAPQPVEASGNVAAFEASRQTCRGIHRQFNRATGSFAPGLLKILLDVISDRAFADHTKRKADSGW